MSGNERHLDRYSDQNTKLSIFSNKLCILVSRRFKPTHFIWSTTFVSALFSSPRRNDANAKYRSQFHFVRRRAGREEARGEAKRILLYLLFAMAIVLNCFLVLPRVIERARASRGQEKPERSRRRLVWFQFKRYFFFCFGLPFICLQCARKGVDDYNVIILGHGNVAVANFSR